jgi:DNA-binding transcriptional LysR family regulator
MKTANINLDRVAAFVAVADAGSFTTAAEHLGSTKSATSQAVAQLERELGTQLLLRSTRKLSITEAGQSFLHDCRALLAQAESVVTRARSGKAQPKGTLRLTSPHESAAMIAGWIATYRERHPEMRIDYVPTDQQVDVIADRFDVAVRIGPMRDSRLHGVKLAELELWTAASATYLARRGIPATPAELAAHEWIALSVLPAPWTYVFTARNGRKITARMRGAVSVSNSAAVRAMVLAGAGISAFPESTIDADVAAGRLTRVLADYGMQKLYLHAAYPGTVGPPAKTRAFIDIAREALRKK